MVKYPFQMVILLFPIPPTFPEEKSEGRRRKKKKNIAEEEKKTEESNTTAFKNNIFSHFRLSLLKWEKNNTK